MKKISAVMLSLILVLCNCMVVFGAGEIGGEGGTTTLTSGNNSANTSVKATYSGGTETKVYRVDVTWGNMQFVYTMGEGKWNPATHAYEASGENSGWNPKDGGNTVTVANHSNTGVNITYSFKNSATGEKQTFKNVKGIFVGTNITAGSESDGIIPYNSSLATAVGTLFVGAPNQIATLNLTGAPTKTFSSDAADTVGTVTVTIADAS